MGSSLTCVGRLWSLLSLISMGLVCVGFYMPYWLTGSMRPANNHTAPPTPAHLGVFRRCVFPRMGADGVPALVEQCGRYSEFSDIPSLWWQVSTISVGVGCGLSVLVALTAMLACCLDDVLTNPAAKFGGALQLLAGMSIAAGCFLYPLGWDNRDVQQVCGESAHLYNLGNCIIAWGYYSTMAGGGGLLLCALLSCNAAKQKPYAYRI